MTSREEIIQQIGERVDELAGKVDKLEPKKYLLNIDDLQRETGVHKNTLYIWLEHGLIPGFKVGKYWYVPVKAIELLAERLAQEYIKKRERENGYAHLSL